MMIPLILISCSSSDYNEQLSGNYYYINDGPPLVYIRPEMMGGPFIPCTIIDYAFNDQFIIAVQKWTEDCGYYTNEAAKKSGNAYNFWIVDHTSNKLIGPLSIDEYIRKRSELEIPDELKLNLTI